MAVIDVSKYAEIDEKFKDQMYKLWGPSLMFFPEDTDSSRMLMATSFQKQMLTLLDPDVPYILTGFENAFGKENKAYKELVGAWRVLDKIDKFGDGRIYTLVLYNEETETYDMIQKPVAEIKSEKFGYVYNTDKMDSLNPGDSVTDEVIYKSTSYDVHMNYRIGKNALVMYSSSNPTIEDAIYVRRGWAESVRFFELDSIFCTLNDNDIFTNRYGDDDNYIPFPMVGGRVEGGIICSTRRIVKDHILYDFQSRNLRESYSTDTDYFTSKDAVVYDIDVYYNGDDEMPDNVFHRQLKVIYEHCCEYADRITEWGKRIKNDCKQTGKHYTQRVPFLISRYQHVSNPEYKWKYKDREFSNVLINFKTCAIVSLESGFKLVGRYGDKGVISKIASDHIAEDTGESQFIETLVSNFAEYIGSDGELSIPEMLSKGTSFHVVEDSEMPYMEDGRKLDVLLNASGAIRRLNTGQLTEVDLAFQSECIRQKIVETDDIDEKFSILFKFLEIVNADEYKFFFGKYSSWSQRVTIDGRTILMLNQKERLAFIKDVEENGIRLVKPADKCIRYDTVKQVYHTFPWIQPVQLYIDKFGIARKKIMRKCIVGYKYLYVLKQTSNKNFSARSMGRVNKKGLPEKSTDKRDNRSAISHNPVKIGEVHNLMSSVSGRDIAEWNIFTRSSPVGRKSLKRILRATGDPAKIHKLKLKDDFRNVNADIFNAYIKTWGIRVNFITDADQEEDAYVDIPQIFHCNGYMVLDCPSRRPMYKRCLDRYTQVYNSTIIVAEDRNSFIWDMIFKESEFQDIPEDMRETLRNVTIGYYDNTKAPREENEE